MQMNIHLAKILVKESMINLNQIRSAFEEQKRTGKGLGEVLVGLGYINESQLVDFLSREYGVPAVNLDELEIEGFVLKLVPRKTVLEHGIVPIGYSGSTLVVAMSDPSNIIAVDDLRFATGYNIKPVVAPERAIQDVIEKHFGMDEVGERIKIERDEEPLEEIIRELEDFKNSVHNSNGTLLSQEDAYESERGEFRSDVNPEEGDVLTLRGVISKSDNINENEYTDSVEVEEEQVVDPFAAPVYSPNHEVAGGREDSISEKEQEEGFDLSILFSKEDESQRQSEEISSWANQVNDISESHSVESSIQTNGFEGYEYVVSDSAGEKEEINPFAAPVYSPNHEVAGGREDSISEKEQEEGFDPSILFSEEDEYWREKEEDSGEQSQREEVLKQTSLFHQGFNSTLQSEEVDNDFALELLQVEEAPRDSETFLRSEDEFTSQKGESSFDRDVTADVSVESGLFSPANSFSPPSYETLSKQEKQFDNPTVIQLYREVETHTPFEFGLEKEQTPRTTVLVVDDSPTIQKIVAITLERKGYQVVTAANAMQALAKLNEVVPNMIFLDINLPHMDGYQVCKIIKANDLTKDVPVVMLSGKDGFFDKVRGRLAGATDYITKPFEPSTLIQAVEKYSG